MSIVRLNQCALALLIVLSPAACGKGGPAKPTPMAPPEVLYNDNSGGIRDSVRQVIRTPAELQAVWRRATSTQSSPPQLPTVDFTRYMVLVAGAGRMSPEDEIHVDSLSTREELTSNNKKVETLNILVRTVQGCRRVRVEAFPVQIVRVRKFDGPVKWEERKVQQTCSD